MNLLFVNLSKNWGGGEKWFYTVGNAMRERGHTVYWLVYPGSELEQRLAAKNLPSQAMKLRTTSLLNSFAMRRLEHWMRSINADAVLLNGSHELKTVGLASWRVKIPKIVFRRGVSYPLKQSFVNRWFIYHIPTHFLANAKATFDAFVEAFPPVAELKNLTLNNGIEMAKWTDVPTQPVANRVLMSARLSPEKGIDRALRAIHILKSRGIEAELHILGEGSEKEKLKSLADSLGIADQIIFAGFVQDIRPELAKAWLFLFTPTHGEGTSLALVEAMAMGIPCVAFDTPAMSEVIVPDETGYLAPEGNIEALADHMQKLLEDTELRSRLGYQARQRSMQHFSLKRLAEKLEAFLEDD